MVRPEQAHHAQRVTNQQVKTQSEEEHGPTAGVVRAGRGFIGLRRPNQLIKRTSQPSQPSQRQIFAGAKEHFGKVRKLDLVPQPAVVRGIENPGRQIETDTVSKATHKVTVVSGFRVALAPALTSERRRQDQDQNGKDDVDHQSRHLRNNLISSVLYLSNPSLSVEGAPLTPSRNVRGTGTTGSYRQSATFHMVKPRTKLKGPTTANMGP